MKALAFPLIFACLCVAAASAASAPSPTPSSAEMPPGRQLTKPQPPPPRQDTNSHPPGPQLLGSDQCVLGENVPTYASVSGLARSEILYVDAGTSVQCTGLVVRWEVCYSIVDTTMATRTCALKMLVLRVGSTKDGVEYEVVGLSELDAAPSDSEAAEPRCAYLDSEGDSLYVKEGDIIAFISGDDVNVALSGTDTTQGRLFEYPLELVTDGLSGVAALGAISQSQLVQTNITSGAPLIRAIINETQTTLTAASATPTPTPSTTTDVPCNQRGREDWPSLTPRVAAVVAVTVVVVFVLVVLVCLFGCCLCHIKCPKIKYLWQCLCCWCRRRKNGGKKTVLDIVGPKVDQSMQYNELYIPHDPTHIIVNGNRVGTRMQNNPAYAVPPLFMVGRAVGYEECTRARAASCSDHCLAKAVEDGERTLDGQAVGLRRTLEHTYETIPACRI